MVTYTVLPAANDWTVTELRQYTLKPGRRDELIDLFEREFVDPLEQSGMSVGGVFRDRVDPDRFVWFRHFRDMASRREALENFYFGNVWGTFKDEANDTMLDSDDVLLLRATMPAHPLPNAPAAPGAWTEAHVYTFPPDEDFATWLATDAHAILSDALEVPVATWRTEPAANTFPRLPIRADNVFVWTADFESESRRSAGIERLERSAQWARSVAPRLDRHLTARQHLELEPTPRSRHHRPVA
jgi:NIPSNAP protein